MDRTVARLTITGCTIIDPETGTAAPGSIAMAGRAIVDDPAPGGDTLDGTGLYAIPGLVDMHVHMTTDVQRGPVPRRSQPTSTSMTLSAVRNLGTALQAGVTTVRDLGAPGDLGYALRAAWADDMFVGARPLVAGPVITAVGGHGSWLGDESEGPASIGALVRRRAADGADVVKLMMRSAERRMELRPEELAEAVAEAHWLDIPVAVHANFSERSVDVAVEAGCDTLEHGYAISESTARAMSTRGVALCSTAGALRSLVERPQLHTRGGSRLVERAVQQYPEARRSFERALAAGVALVAGTDAGVPGVGFDALPAELETLVDWGASPQQVLVAATSGAARALRRPELGALSAGSVADVVLLRRDPRTDVSAYREVEAVVQAGRLVRLDARERLADGTARHVPQTVDAGRDAAR